ncbi:hypothetical protein QBC42DRAFT_91002 [Cladorrhinum samala]|uniref:Uncharacterized protein n=1 Tax=Cladorrhinum samala TaxID=585594 RepID=A0AAV9HZJ6_9PEZI|nr:hypothetical protein QBC42DRAFT_91002 [Cladorrhinum samala]
MAEPSSFMSSIPSQPGRQDLSCHEIDPEKLANTLSDLFPDQDHWIEIRHTVYSIHAPRPLSRGEISKCGFESSTEASTNNQFETQPHGRKRRGWRRLNWRPFWQLS